MEKTTRQAPSGSGGTDDFTKSAPPGDRIFGRQEAGRLWLTVSLVVLAILAVRRPSVPGILSCCAAGVLSWRMTAGKNPPAAGSLALLVFLDVLAWLGTLLKTLRVGLTFSPAAGQGGRQWWILLAAGILMTLLGQAKKRPLWVSAAGEALVGVALILHIWGNGNFLHPTLAAGGGVILSAFIIAAAGWFLVAQVAAITAPDRNGGIRRMGLVLTVIAVVLFLTEQNLMMTLAQNFSVNGWHRKLSSWPAVAIFCMFFAGAAMGTYEGGGKIGVDALVFEFVGTMIPAMKIMLTMWFPLNGLALAVLAVSGLAAVNHERRGRKTLKLRNDLLIPVLGAALISACLLIRQGLWLMAVIALAFGVPAASVRRKDTRRKIRWFLLLNFLAAEAVAWVLTMRFHRSTLMVLLLCWVSAAVGMLILNWPGSRKTPWFLQAGVCVLLALLCLIPMSRRGTAVRFTQGNGTVMIQLQANGKDNAVAVAGYYWSSAVGKQIGEKAALTKQATSVPAKGACLTVVVTDTYGIRTTRRTWIPYSNRAVAPDS